MCLFARCGRRPSIPASGICKLLSGSVILTKPKLMFVANSIEGNSPTGLLARNTRVLILCSGAQSRMAEALFRHEAAGAYDIFSAETNPSQVRPEAIAVMGEIDIDISSHRSHSMEEFIGQGFDYVITVSKHTRRLGPKFPGETIHLHWSVDDPAVMQESDAGRKAAFRSIRDELHERIRAFLWVRPNWRSINR
jgi:arsenate reductase (thioredoxin)